MNKYFEKFKQKAFKKFGNSYSYHIFNYVNAKTKGTIICAIHGEFQQSPDKHLNSMFPCPACLVKHRSDSLKGVVSKSATDLHNTAKRYITRVS